MIGLVGTWSGVSASEVVGKVTEVGEVVGEVTEVVGELTEVVGEVSEVVGELAEVVGDIAEVSPRSPMLAWSHLWHDVSMASSELNCG